MNDERYLFLDVDGVLNSHEHFEAFFARMGEGVRDDLDMFAPELVGRLNRFVAATEVKIVVSSSWRIGETLSSMREILERAGVKGEVVGLTPHLNTARGREIDAWLRIEAMLNPASTAFVIVDDDSDMAPHLDRLAKTSEKVGFQDHDALYAALILKHGRVPRSALTVTDEALIDALTGGADAATKKAVVERVVDMARGFWEGR